MRCPRDLAVGCNGRVWSGIRRLTALAAFAQARFRGQGVPLWGDSLHCSPGAALGAIPRASMRSPASRVVTGPYWYVRWGNGHYRAVALFCCALRSILERDEWQSWQLSGRAFVSSAAANTSVDLSTQRPHALDAVPVRARCEHRSAVKTLVPCPPNIYLGARRKRVGDATLID